MDDFELTNLYEKNIKNNYKILNKNFKLKQRESIEDNTPYRTNNIEENKKNADDSTKYGEFVSSFFNWMTLDQQKNRANELNDITKKSKN